MILYHFCAARYLKSILHAGLTMGVVTYPTDTGFRMRSGFQWLTKNGDVKAQSWATKKVIPYCRTSYRLTIRIPDEEVGSRLITGEELVKEMPATVHLFNSWPGSEDWMIFKGTVPREWIISVVDMRTDSGQSGGGRCA